MGKPKTTLGVQPRAQSKGNNDDDKKYQTRPA